MDASEIVVLIELGADPRNLEVADSQFLDSLAGAVERFHLSAGAADALRSGRPVFVEAHDGQPNVRVTPPDGERDLCPDCGGDGYLTEQFAAYGQRPWDPPAEREVRCGRCDGTGLAPVDEFNEPV